MRSGKELAIARKQLEETELKHHIEAMARQKKEDAAAKAKIVEQLEREKAARFGKDYVPKVAKEKTPAELFNDIWEKQRKVYMGQTDMVRTLYKTLLVYLGKNFFLLNV